MMRKQWPIRAIVLCAGAMSLAACQSMSDGSKSASSTAGTSVASCDSANGNGQMIKLQKENAKLKRQLAETMQDNATLRDLAAKEW